MSEAERWVLEFDEESEEFNQTSGSGTLDTDRSTYLIIDEGERKMTVSYRPGISIVLKRKIERRVNSYSKSGFSLGDKRIGLGFPLEQVNAEEKLPDILLTHGHTFGRRLERDEIPPYAEPEPNMDIVPGIAAVKTDILTDTSRHVVKTEPVPTSTETTATPPPSVESQISQTQSTPETVPKVEPTPEPTPKVEPESTPISGKTIELKGGTSSIQSSDDAVWALGQFIEQYTRQGKICVVAFEDSGKFRLVTLKDSTMKIDESKVDGNYRVDDVNLFEV
jgi:hypothetical protein